MSNQKPNCFTLELLHTLYANLHARTNCYTLERIATRSNELLHARKPMEPNKMMEIWRLNSILFFFVPGQLEETDQVVALLRGFNQVVRKEKYKEGWMLVLIHPALSNQFSIHHKMDDIELEIKKDCGVWTMVINNLSVFHTHPSKLSKEFPYSAHVTNYKAPFSERDNNVRVCRVPAAKSS